LPKPLRHFHISARFAFLTALVMMFATLHLPSVHHNTAGDGCAHDAEENKMRKEILANKT